MRIKWAIERVTDPAAEALTTTEAKKHLRVEHSDDDGYIADLSKGAREWLEDETNRSFVLQTWDFFQDEFPPSSEMFLELPRGPVRSVTSVKYNTTTSTGATTLSATTYLVDTASEPARVYLKEGESWPTNELRKANGVEVRYTAGMATSATGVDQQAKHCLRLMVGSWYVNRESVVVGAINTPLDLAVKSLKSKLSKRRYM